MKPISILGSTGSIGRQCLDVVASNPGTFQIVALAAGHNVKLAAEQAQKYQPQIISAATEAAAKELCAILKSTRDKNHPQPEILFGPEGMERVATHPEAEIIVSAAVGVVGLPATYKAIEAGKHIALANKEVLVAAGEVVMAAVHRQKIALLPVDSEHNAIHQCLRAGE
ncbi:MAG: 1-deoxy-D-xylulose-5-phosphate reductoisomerase, partial [Candidatus Acidiferrales bacterium]